MYSNERYLGIAGVIFTLYKQAEKKKKIIASRKVTCKSSIRYVVSEERDFTVA